MQTRTENIESLLTQGVFDIPDYQRGYSWVDRQLSELLDDIRYLPDDRKHFFGNIILEEQSSPYETVSHRQLSSYHVVDGQQRLTSALVFLDVSRELDDRVATLINESNAIHVPKDRPRLLPQEDDREFFRDGVLGDTDLNAETPSQHRLENAREYFEKQLTDLEDIVDVADLAKTLLYQFEVNVVEVDDGSEAASIFESINDRGKPLSSLDKTKSFLMYMDGRSAVQESHRQKIHDRFGGIYRQLFVLENGHDLVRNFDEDTFQQLHWGFYDGYDSDEYFNPLDTLKSQIYESYRRGEHEAVSSTIDAYTESLREASNAFEQFFRPNAWQSDEITDSLVRLLSQGRVANVLPVLLVSILQYEDDPDRLSSIVRKCESLVFRVYAIDGRRSNTGRNQLVNLAHDMYTDPNHEYEETIRRLGEITRRYTDDDRFERALRDPEFYDSVSSTDIRYLLYHYGQQLEADLNEVVHKDLEQILSTDFSVEHVLARNLDDTHIPDEILEEYDDHVDRLGNLTIAGREWNSKYGDLPFHLKKEVPPNEEKEPAYEKSSLKVQRILKQVNDFDLQTINEREEKIVQFALEEWPIDSRKLDDEAVVTVRSLADERPDSGHLNFDELPVTKAELYVLAAVMEDPDSALRSIHETAAGLDGTPVEWNESWGDERKRVQRALWSLRTMGLASLENRSWQLGDQLEDA